jgi:hypothetical protein
MKTLSGIKSYPAAQVDKSIEALRKAALVCRVCPLRTPTYTSGRD